MRSALALVLASYGLALALLAAGAVALPLLRTRVAGGFTLGDVAVAVLLMLYGLIIYILGRHITYGPCRGGS